MLFRSGFFSSRDLADEGFIHMSTIETVLGTATRYYAAHDKLRLLVIDDAALAAELPNALRWEMSPSRKALFPHCFIALPIKFVVQTAWLGRQDGEAREWMLPVEISSSAPN